MPSVGDRFRPAYLGLDRSELKRRVESAVAMLADCRACPRDCGVNRLEDHWSACKTGRHAVVASYFPHFGEEDCLRGWKGSGTIFFAHCNLRCVFCQNWDISQAVKPGPAAPGSSADEIASMMLELQDHGCHNINFVTPEHVVPQVLEAVYEAVGMGLRLPIVYNTGAYDSLHSIELLDGVVDVYMPDFKFWDGAVAKRLVLAEDYPQTARAAVLAMHRQVGDLVCDEDGLALRGLLVRHLVMPGGLAGTREVLRFLAEEVSPDTYLNIMDQYSPAGQVVKRPEQYADIGRRITSAELAQAREIAREVGLRRLDERWRRMGFAIAL